MYIPLQGQDSNPLLILFNIIAGHKDGHLTDRENVAMEYAHAWRYNENA